MNPETSCQGDGSRYLLRLFVSGMTPNSLRAIENARQICHEHLKGSYRLEIVDIYQNPGRAKEDQIVAVPTLVKELPLPRQRFVGDLSQTELILSGLGQAGARLP
jgi:circadian clock protein KaiB